MFEELGKAMSISELEQLKVMYKDNVSVSSILDGYIANKQSEIAQVKAKEGFQKKIGKLFETLPHPEDIHNVYASWREVEIEDVTQNLSIVEIVDTPAVMDKDGKITTPAVVHDEQRYPMISTHQWVIEVNKAMTYKSGSGDASGTPKRAIDVFKHNPEGADTKMGSYPSGTKACEALKLTIGGDSATRVLAREGYYTKPVVDANQV